MLSMSTVNSTHLSTTISPSLPEGKRAPRSVATNTNANTKKKKKSFEADEMLANGIDGRRINPLSEAVQEVEFPASVLHIDVCEARQGDPCDPHDDNNNNNEGQSSQSSAFLEVNRDRVAIPKIDGQRHEGNNKNNNNIPLKEQYESDDEGKGTEDDTVGPSFTEDSSRGFPPTNLETSNNNIITKERPFIAAAAVEYAIPTSPRLHTDALNQNETTRTRTRGRRSKTRSASMVRNRRAHAPQSLCSLLAERVVSVVSLAGFMAFASGLVCLVVVLSAVSLTSNQRSGAGEKDALLNSFNVQMRSAVAPEAFRPLIHSFLQLDKTQHFGMQRAEVEEVMTTLHSGPTYCVNTTEPPREEIFAPTADASALLSLGPFISELMSHTVSSVHQIQSELGAKSGSLSSIAYLLPHASVSLEDGRHVSFELQYSGNVYATVIDGGDPNRIFSGEFTGVFPLINRSTMPNSQAISTVHVDTTPPGRTAEHQPLYYTYSERLITAYDGSSTSLNPTFTADVSSALSEVWSPTPPLSGRLQMSTRLIWENLGFTRRSLPYDAARGKMAPMQKRVYGLVQNNAVTLTLVAPIYTRWLRITKGNSYQRALTPYRSKETDARYLENIINDNYVLIGVAMSQLSLVGLKKHLIGLVQTFQSNRNAALVDKSVPIPELFLIRRDIVWATSHGDRTSYLQNVEGEKDSTDQDGVTLCDPSYCAYTIQSYRYGPLLAAYRAHPAIARPTRAKPTDPPPPSATTTENRVKAFMMSSSSVGLNQEGTGGSAMFTHINNETGEAELWFLSYSEMAPPSTAQRPFGDVTDSATPFVFLALARAPAGYLFSRDRCGVNIQVLVAIATVTLLIVGVLVAVVSRVILRPLSEISALIAEGAHLLVVMERSSGSSSSPTEDDEALRTEEEAQRQMSDRTPSSWLEVRCLQKAYWLMSDQLQTLAAYIPENVIEELLDATHTGKSRWPGDKSTCRRSLNRNHRSSDSPPQNMNGGYLSAGAAAAAAPDTAFGAVRPPFRTPRSPSVEAEFYSSADQRTHHTNKNPVHNVLRGQPPPPPSDQLNTVGVEGLAIEMTNSTSRPAETGSEGSNIRISMHSMLSLGVVLESQNEKGSISSSAGSSSGVPRSILFADRVLVDRDITAVHINIFSFHTYAENTSGVTISRDYESFISFIHAEARRFGGMLESFSGDKVWVSFNASSKCINGPVAAAYYAYSVASAINNAAVRRGAVRSKSFSHPIFTNSGRERFFRVARCGITCGIATGRAFVGPLGNSSVKRHTIISNAISEAASLERQALRYPGCKVLMAGDMIPAVEGYCQYLLIDATLLPGSHKKRRRLACVKGPMLANNKNAKVFHELWTSSQEQSIGIGNIPSSNPYAKINDAMNAFLEGQAERCKQLVAEIKADLNVTTATLGYSGASGGRVAADANECEWDRKERISLTEIMVRFFELLFTLNLEGRSYTSQLGEQYAPKSHALCAYILDELGLEVSDDEDDGDNWLF